MLITGITKPLQQSYAEEYTTLRTDVMYDLTHIRGVSTRPTIVDEGNSFVQVQFASAEDAVMACGELNLREYVGKEVQFMIAARILFEWVKS